MKTLLYIFILSFISFQIEVDAQTIFDTTQWKKSICTNANFSISYPTIYFIKNECGIFYKEMNGTKMYPIHPFSANFYPAHDYLMKVDPQTYNDWIEYRARLLYSADGPGESYYGDSVALNKTFKNRNGIIGNELYIYVTNTKYEKGGVVKASAIRGPVYVFKRNQDLSNIELTLLFQLREDQCDSIDRKLVDLMFDTFNWIRN